MSTSKQSPLSSVSACGENSTRSLASPLPTKPEERLCGGPIAKSYWRSIRRGTRTFAAVPDSQKEAVRELARAEVEAGLLTDKEYLDFIGEEYWAE